MDFKQNCWIVFNKPFGDERNDYILVEKYQENCISKKYLEWVGIIKMILTINR